MSSEGGGEADKVVNSTSSFGVPNYMTVVAEGSKECCGEGRDMYAL